MIPDLSPLIFFVWFSAFGVGVAAALVIIAIVSIFVPVPTIGWLAGPLLTGAAAAVAAKVWLGD